MSAGASVSTWRKVLAAILDFLTVFFVAGYAISAFTGERTDGGFALEGGSALLAIAIVVAYFIIGNRYAGGTIWQRILRAR